MPTSLLSVTFIAQRAIPLSHTRGVHGTTICRKLATVASVDTVPLPPCSQDDPSVGRATQPAGSTVPSPAALRSHGGHPALLTALGELVEGGIPARVIRVDRDRVAVTDGRRELRTDPEQSLIDDPDTGLTGLPAIGEWLLISPDDVPAVLAMGQRYGRLVRRDPGAPQPQILAVGG